MRKLLATLFILLFIPSQLLALSWCEYLEKNQIEVVCDELDVSNNGRTDIIVFLTPEDLRPFPFHENPLISNFIYYSVFAAHYSKERKRDLFVLYVLFDDKEVAIFIKTKKLRRCLRKKPEKALECLLHKARYVVHEATPEASS